MRTSKVPVHASLRHLASAAGVVCAFVGVCWLLGWALGPYGTNTQIIWWDYRNSADATFDTLLCGSSYCMSGFDAACVDEALGSSSYSLSTASQALEDSFDAIQTAVADHGVTRVVLGVEYAIFTSRPAIQTASTILAAQNQTLPPSQQLENTLKVMTRPYFWGGKSSLECLFPWSFNHVELDVASVAQNVRNRLECANPIEAGKRYMPNWIYAGRGYFEIYGPMDYDASGNAYPPFAPGSQPHLDDRLAQMQQILDFCAAHDVDLYVVVMPQPAFNVLRYGDDYPAAMADLERRVEAAGAVYMDFNLALPPTYVSDPYDFSDNEHMDTNGARRFCPYLGRAIRAIEAGQDPHALFYSYADWDAWRESLHYISLAGCYSTVTEGAVELEAWALAGSGVEAEYRLSAVGENGETCTVLRDWDGDPRYLWPCTGHGVQTFLVEVRSAAYPDAEQRSCRIDVYY